LIALLRRVHFRIAVALAAFLPAAFAAGWLSRPDFPAAATLPRAVSAWEEGELVWSNDALFAAAQITTRALRTPNGWIVELVPRETLLRPDVLVYWTPDAAGEFDSGAHFLGRLGGGRAHRFVLPAWDVPDPDGRARHAEGPGGTVFLYSLGHQELIDRAALAPASESARP